jgi:hypothetical protein
MNVLWLAFEVSQRGMGYSKLTGCHSLGNPRAALNAAV